jgi:hypothetical protein
MNQKAVDYLYEYAKGQGYQNPKESFVTLIQTNDEAFNKLYESAKSSGYGNDINAFGLLVGRTPKEQTTAVKDVTPQDQSAMVVRKPVEPGGRGEGAAPRVASEGAGGETPEATPSAIEADINRQLLPVTENTQIKEVPTASDKMVIKSEAKKQEPVPQKDFLAVADEVLNNIYNSPGYLKKLEEEIAQSKALKYDPKMKNELLAKQKEVMDKLRSLPKGSPEESKLWEDLRVIGSELSDKYSDFYTGGNYSTADLVSERKGRVNTTPVELVKSTDEYNYLDDEDYSGLGGEMQPRFANERPSPGMYEPYEDFEKRQNEFYSKEQPMNTNIELFVDNFSRKPLKSNEYNPADYRSDLMAIAIEEKEHASHIPKNNPKGERNKVENITPYAEKIVKENTILNEESDDGYYLTEPTEVIAKKRATEVNLIGRGLLEPGGQATESNFKELLKSKDLPFNIIQLLQSVSGEINEGKVQDKILNDPKLYKESLDRWLNIMNKIAFVDKKGKTFDINPFGIDKTKTG